MAEKPKEPEIIRIMSIVMICGSYAVKKEKSEEVQSQFKTLNVW